MLKFLTNKMKYLRAQSAIEFFTVAGMAFIAAIFFIGISANEVREIKDQKEFLLIKDLGMKLQKEVVIASQVEDGYKRTFKLPDKLEAVVDYFIVMSNETITINSSKSVFFVHIIGVTGNFTKGNNKIEKINGEIYINR